MRAPLRAHTACRHGGGGCRVPMPAAPTWPTCAGRRTPSARSRWRPPARIRCCSPGRPAPASRCSRNGCRRCCRRCRKTRRWKWRRWRRSPAASRRRIGAHVRFARRITRPAAWRWWAAAATRGRARFRSRITASCSWTSCPSGTGACWRCCASRIESGVIHISRAARQSSFPAQFQLVAAMNPCPCGWLGDIRGRCRCTPDRIARYRARVSGPLLDRIDLALDVPSLAAESLAMRAVVPPANGTGQPASLHGREWEHRDGRGRVRDRARPRRRAPARSSANGRASPMRGCHRRKSRSTACRTRQARPCWRRRCEGSRSRRARITGS